MISNSLIFIHNMLLNYWVGWCFALKTGARVVYSKYAGTEVEFDGSSHLILKEDDIIGILETDDIRDLKPLNDRVFIKVHYPPLSIGWCILISIFH